MPFSKCILNRKSETYVPLNTLLRIFHAMNHLQSEVGDTIRLHTREDSQDVDYLVCDALRCSVPHVRYTSARFPWPKGSGNPLNLLCARDWGLQLFPMNEEFPVSASHKLALITFCPLYTPPLNEIRAQAVRDDAH
ncbi:hypothetical protein WN51_01743 [Melipona quadrifasciata]|uniref:Uncharacterized protein n=1 Tax=Melipona quadrifasciata TaxID=166423 RepID=A0A0N0U4N4_9HYME|nr:hypothetical protein WN51_01743 [Melipona quadrifasciata]